MINAHGMAGKFKIKVIDSKTKKVKKNVVIRNRITNVALNEMAKALTGDNVDLEIMYLALGDGTTPLSDTDTTLANETFRTAFLTVATNGEVGQVASETFVIDVEAVGTINEIGIFCGSTATASADTGIMLSRILWNHEKTNLEEIQVNRLDTITRA